MDPTLVSDIFMGISFIVYNIKPFCIGKISFECEHWWNVFKLVDPLIIWKRFLELQFVVNLIRLRKKSDAVGSHGIYDSNTWKGDSI